MKTLKQRLQTNYGIEIHKCAPFEKCDLIDDILKEVKEWLEQKRQPYQFRSFQYIVITELLEELKEVKK